MCSSDTVCVWQDANTIDEAVKQLQDSGCTQPVLFRFQQMFWVKADNTAVAAHFDCITDAFEFLFQLFFIMNVQYPPELWLVYGFFEKVLGVKGEVGKSVRLAEFCQQVLQGVQ